MVNSDERVHDIEVQMTRMSNDVHHIKEKIDELIGYMNVVYENRTRHDKSESRLNYIEKEVKDLKKLFWTAVSTLATVLLSVIFFLIKMLINN